MEIVENVTKMASKCMKKYNFRADLLKCMKNKPLGSAMTMMAVGFVTGMLIARKY